MPRQSSISFSIGSLREWRTTRSVRSGSCRRQYRPDEDEAQIKMHHLRRIEWFGSSEFLFAAAQGKSPEAGAKQKERRGFRGRCRRRRSVYVVSRDDLHITTATTKD